MDVQLLTVTPNALDVLLFTKNTRLKMSPDGLAEVAAWPEEKKAAELEYMRNTIQSSWEFVDYVFAITGVTRAFTHQLVRHRVGTSFAQQAQRVVNMDGFDYLVTGPEMTGRASENVTINSRARMHLDDSAPFTVYADAMAAINDAYGDLLDKGVKPQDARGVLPTNICTNIIFKANLRTLHDMALKRLCVKAQGEFQDVFKRLVDRVVEVHPWASRFLRVQCAWNGTCLFPSLPVEDCHVKPHVYNPETTRSYGADALGIELTPSLAAHPSVQLYTTEEIYQLHRSKRTEIQPRIAGASDDSTRYTPTMLSCGVCERHAMGFVGDRCEDENCLGHLEPLDRPKYSEELVQAFMADARNGADLHDVRGNLIQESSLASVDEAIRRLDAEGGARSIDMVEEGEPLATSGQAPTRDPSELPAPEGLETPLG